MTSICTFGSDNSVPPAHCCLRRFHCGFQLLWSSILSFSQSLFISHHPRFIFSPRLTWALKTNATIWHGSFLLKYTVRLHSTSIPSWSWPKALIISQDLLHMWDDSQIWVLASSHYITITVPGIPCFSSNHHHVYKSSTIQSWSRSQLQFLNMRMLWTSTKLTKDMYAFMICIISSTLKLLYNNEGERSRI